MSTTDPRFQRALDAAAGLRPDWSPERRHAALRRALVEKHGLHGLDAQLIVPWEAVMLTAAHLELSTDDPWIVRPLWVALLGEEPGTCSKCGGPCDAAVETCWGCGKLPA